MARLLITLSLGDLMLEEEKVMAITKHKSVLQMRKDYGIPQFDHAPHQSYAQHPTTIRAATSRAVHLYQEVNPLMSLATFSHFPEQAFRHTMGCLPLSHNCLSPHNQILTKLDKTEKQLEELKAANRKLMNMVAQLIARPVKRRRLLATLVLIPN